MGVRAARAQAKVCRGTWGIRHESGRVARPPWYDGAPDWTPGRGFSSMDHFKNGVAFASSQIESDRIATFLQMLQGFHVRIGQVIHVDVVANAGSIRSGIVTPENLEFGAFLRSGKRERNQVGLGIMQFAD